VAPVDERADASIGRAANRDAMQSRDAPVGLTMRTKIVAAA
jgi:hypothetical protein